MLAATFRDFAISASAGEQILADGGVLPLIRLFLYRPTADAQNIAAGALGNLAFHSSAARRPQHANDILFTEGRVIYILGKLIASLSLAQFSR